MRIAVGGLVHDRWTIPAYLDAMLDLRLGEHDIEWCWVADGYERALPGNVTRVTALDLPAYCRQGGTPTEKQPWQRRLAYLRNILREMALALDCDALFACDSDILPPPDTLLRLAESGRPWVGALVHNAPGEEVWNVYHVTHIENSGGLLSHFRATGVGLGGVRWPGPEGAGWDPRDVKQRADLATGAVCLYRRELLERARWESHPRGGGEDTGFALQAFRAGYTAWYLPIICQHLTIEGSAQHE